MQGDAGSAFADGLDAAPAIVEARQDVHVEVEHALAGGRAVVPADVEPRRVKGFRQPLDHLHHRPEERAGRAVVQLEQRGGVLPGDHQGVAPGDGEAIQEGDRARRLEDHLGGTGAGDDLAEEALGVSTGLGGGHGASGAGRGTQARW